ncbi:hypothetical protein [Streptococcus hyointestinalis]
MTPLLLNLTDTDYQTLRAFTHRITAVEELLQDETLKRRYPRLEQELDTIYSEQNAFIAHLKTRQEKTT